MASCLYECLCEAGLQRYYPQFTALGLRRPGHLSHLTMSDYPRLGVHHMQDRTRLFHLVQLVKALQGGQEKEEEEEEEESNTPPMRGTPRRQLDFSTPAQPKAPRPQPRHGSDMERPLHKHSHSKGRAAATHRPSSPAEEEPALVHRVAHSQGYNYGLPCSSTRYPAPLGSGGIPGPSGADRIRVCVRKRPLGRGEERRGEVDVVSIRDARSLLVHEKKEAVDLTQYILQHVFYFDDVFDESCSSEDVYLKTASPLIQHIFSGGKATCFAYGQTGAGKTHTMMGTARSPGLYALAARDIFKQLGELAPGRPALHVCISFFEIYCGQLYDLLDHRKRLFAREDGHHVVQIVGLREERVESVATLLEIISWGSRERSRGASGVNADSSRSHAILQIHVKNNSHRLIGRISFIDLAGSERAADTRDPDRQTKMEGAEINQSLLALKECIRALDQEQSHTPFRQSKLTQVLKDSFVGNSKTCMIANISPSYIATEHTLNTLRYADRVKELKKGVKPSPSYKGASRLVGSPSPKRNKNPCRERTSPKKVRLGGFKGARDPAGLLPGDAEAGIFSTNGTLLCSTPKTGTTTLAQASAREAWPVHTAVGRGALNRGTQEEKWAQGRRDGGVNSAGSASVAHKAQAVTRPVWKETVPREHLRDSSLGGVSVQESKRAQGGLETSHPWAESHLHQREGEIERWREREREGEGCMQWRPEIKNRDDMDWKRRREWGRGSEEERERQSHLRKYHQQLQQPHILQQTRLPYQPLEELLARYRAQSMELDSIRGPAFRLHGHMSPEDTAEDSPSDCSQDSLSVVGGSSSEEDSVSVHAEVSHVCGCRSEPCAPVHLDRSRTGDSRAEVGSGGDLVELDRGDWEDRSRPQQREREVVDKPALLEPGISESWGQGGRPRWGDWQQDRQGLSDWSTEEDLPTYRSNASNNAPEKPYSPTGDQQQGSSYLNDLSADHKQINSVLSDELGDLTPSPPRACVNIPPTEADLCGVGAGGDAVRTLMSPVTGATEAHEDSSSVCPPHSDDSAATMDPLTISLLDIERQAATDSFFHCGSPSPGLSQAGGTREEPNEEMHCPPEGPPVPPGQSPQYAMAQDGHKGQPHTQLEPSLPTAVTAVKCAPTDCTALGLRPCEERSEVCATRPSLSLIPIPGSFLESSALEASVTPSHDASDLAVPSEDFPLPPSGLSPASTTQEGSRVGFSSPGLVWQPGSIRGELGPAELSPILPAPAAVMPGQSPSQEPGPGESWTWRGAELWQEGLADYRLLRLRAEVLEALGLKLSDTQGSSQAGSEGMAEADPSSPLRSEQGSLPSPEDRAAEQGVTQHGSPVPSLPSPTGAGQPLRLAQQQDALGRAQRLVVQAHHEELEEMASLGRREQALLSLQPDMDFTDYVLKLEEIMELKAKCVRSVRAQLQLYLTYPGATCS
ncbi:kinesin-like protein KIF24 [Amia ocellicauda]|uniref:kinesin-like protein KIF24 n=1 Tax=Amia ocellicauda TaxID=2972642 RepID=UPI003464E0AA